MYGTYSVPLSLQKDAFSILVQRKNDILLYTREAAGETVEKSLFTKNCTMLVNPVEPLNTPRHITPYLLIEFGTNFIVEPKGTNRIYVRFPVEIGIFAGESVKYGKDFQLVDLFTLKSNKYTLYGDIRSGVLCKYCKSDVYMSVPEANPLLEGVMELNVTNRTDKWIEVSKAVFNAYLMKLYFNENHVAMKAAMNIHDRDIAETSFVDSPIVKGMKKSLEYYISRGLILTTSSYMMEWGL